MIVVNEREAEKASRGQLNILRLLLDYADEKGRAWYAHDEWEKVVLRGGRANHSVANAGNPSQGQDQSVNPVQSAEGLVRFCLSTFLLALLYVLFYVCDARKNL